VLKLELSIRLLCASMPKALQRYSMLLVYSFDLPEAVVVKNATVLPESPIRADGRLRRTAGVEPGARILLYQGGYSRLRGLDILVRAAPLLPEPWVLVMMGWGAFEQKLRTIASEVDPSGRWIRFIPGVPRDELAIWTADADLGVIPYENVCLNHWFCSPNKLWEYPVAGVPLLVSPFPELAGVVQKWGIGRQIDDPPTPKGIAEAVASISEAELATMSANCRVYIEADNWSVYERRLELLYRRLARVHGPDSDGEKAGLFMVEEKDSAARQSVASGI